MENSTTPLAEDYFLDIYFSDSISTEDKKLWLECNNQAKESIKIMIGFAKLHVEKALLEASLNAKMCANIEKTSIVIDRESILKAYPSENIK